MGVVYVDGDLTVTATGTLYTWSISAGSGNFSDNARIITPPNGVLEITDIEGSIFDTYYVRGDVAATGIVVGGVEQMCYKYKFTNSDYEKGKRLVNGILDHIRNSELEDDKKDLLYQQQYTSIISLMEHFLSCSFVGHICNHEESYHSVLQSGLLQQYCKDKTTLNGPDCIKKELLFIDQANTIVYHNQHKVKKLFEAAFGINVDLSPLEVQLNIRHNITHRFGYSKSVLGGKVNVTYDNVIALMTAVDAIVRNTQSQLPMLPSNICDLSSIGYLLGD